MLHRISDAVGFQKRSSTEVCRFNCNVFASYHSYKALSARNALESTRWLMYWCVMAAFLSLENVLYSLLHTIVPFYPEIKVVMLLFLVASSHAPIYVLHQWIIPKLEALNIPYYFNHVLMSQASTYLTYAVGVIFSKLAKKSAQLNKNDLEYLDAAIGSIDDVSYELKKIRKEAHEQQHRLQHRGSSTSMRSASSSGRLSMSIGDVLSNSGLISGASTNN